MSILPKLHQPGQRVMFRKANEQIGKDFGILEKMAREERDDIYKTHLDMLLHFYCECSDKNCHERIALKLSKYKALHVDRSYFTVAPIHVRKSPAEEIATKNQVSNLTAI